MRGMAFPLQKLHPPLPRLSGLGTYFFPFFDRSDRKDYIDPPKLVRLPNKHLLFRLLSTVSLFFNKPNDELTSPIHLGSHRWHLGMHLLPEQQDCLRKFVLLQGYASSRNASTGVGRLYRPHSDTGENDASG